MRDNVKLVVRLPKALHEHLVQQAKRNHSSKNQTILNALTGTADLAAHIKSLRAVNEKLAATIEGKTLVFKDGEHGIKLVRPYRAEDRA